MTKLVACFGAKYEPQWLLDQARDHFLTFCDDVAIVDCRHRTDELWIDEGEYRKLQRKACLEKGADWILVTSADERFEDRAKEVIRPLIEGHQQKIIFNFPLREMWTPTEYRVDGIWGRKRRPRLYPLLKGQTMSDKRIQSSPVPIDAEYKKVAVDLNLYHLKMINPESRVTRAKVFEALDPNYESQPRTKSKRRKRLDPGDLINKHGYHYLYNEEGIKLETIPEGRGYSPPYREYVFKVPGFE